MNESFYLTVRQPEIAFIQEHEGQQVGPTSEDGTYQVLFPRVGMRILSQDGTVEGRETESWSRTPVTLCPIRLASL